MSSTKRINEKAFFRDFKKTFQLPRRKPGAPIIVAIAGPSRVGKTTALKFVQKKLPYFVRLCHDDMRLFLRERGHSVPAVEKFLNESLPIATLGEYFLREGYSVMLDANFATDSKKIELVKKFSKKMEAPLFVIRAWAPASVVRERLRGKKTALFPDWRVGLRHFERSRKQFDYEKLKSLYVARVNTAKPLETQLKKPMKLFWETMRGGR